ncbi:MAG: zinc ABC transporter substrate-binding protein [Leptospiraceae bacterium]|nr:zinc ABC transporter substrate-binding protein [Leptospiraceae bacterium]
MKKYLILLIILLSFQLEAKVKLVATTTTIKYIADQIGKSKIESISMIRGVDDPHFVMTRPDFLVKLNQADIFCQIGLDLEIGWAPLLLQQSRNIKIQKGQPGYCDTSVGIKILGEPTVMMDRSMGDMHIYGNPHFWLDPINVIQMASNILAALKRVDPLNSEYYDKNFSNFKTIIINFTKTEMKSFKPYFGKKVAVFHDQFIYLSNRFKFIANLTLEERPGIPPSNRYLEKVIEKMKSDNIKIILISPYHNMNYAKFVASKVPGSQILVMPESIGSRDDIKTYEMSIHTMLTMLKKAFSEVK